MPVLQPPVRDHRLHTPDIHPLFRLFGARADPQVSEGILGLQVPLPRGMGTAYKAVSEDYPTEKFAVKLLPHGKKTDPILIDTLANEAGMIYSLGMTMYYALTGRTFFDGITTCGSSSRCMRFVTGRRIALVNWTTSAMA